MALIKNYPPTKQAAPKSLFLLTIFFLSEQNKFISKKILYMLQFGKSKHPKTRKLK